MRHIKTITLIAFLCFYSNGKAQLSTNEKPVSFDSKMNLTIISKSALPVATMPQLNMAEIEKEDKEDEEYDMPPRFGYQHKVDYNLNNSGIWYELPNGDKLWQLNVVCPNALSVNFCYDKFWIPEGGKLFVYSTDRKHIIGAFTSRNNKGDRKNIRGFATGLVYGDNVMIEYYQPKNVDTNAIISIEYVIHGYRYVKIGNYDRGSSGLCQINVNCSEGQNWQNEKKSIALIVINGYRLCTGALINTTELNQEPLFLTANHCVSMYGDGMHQTNLFYYSFYWNYEAPDCANVNIEPIPYSTDGAKILANNSLSDFALLRLTEDPKEISNYTPFYLGWDCTGQSGEAGVCIHHPSGDVKKISTVAAQPVSTDNHVFTNSYTESHWQVRWKETENGHGTTERVSSGSPLLSASHKVIGQLHSGSASCSNPNGYDRYGKFSMSWTGNENDSICRRLNCWLDSINEGVNTMEGLLVISTDTIMTTSQKLYSNIRVTGNCQLTIQCNIELMGNCQVIVENGSKIVINGGTLSNVELVLKPGSLLRIINNGIIETRNSFIAPAGAEVDVEYGQVLLKNS